MYAALYCDIIRNGRTASRLCFHSFWIESADYGNHKHKAKKCHLQEGALRPDRKCKVQIVRLRNKMEERKKTPHNRHKNDKKIVGQARKSLKNAHFF